MDSSLKSRFWAGATAKRVLQPELYRTELWDNGVCRNLEKPTKVGRQGVVVMEHYGWKGSQGACG